MLPKSIARPDNGCSDTRGNRTGSEEYSKVSSTLQYHKRDDPVQNIDRIILTGNLTGMVMKRR